MAMFRCKNKYYLIIKIFYSSNINIVIIFYYINIIWLLFSINEKGLLLLLFCKKIDILR